MKYGPFIVPAILLSVVLVLAFTGGTLLDPLADLMLRVFLLVALPSWWVAFRCRRRPPLRSPIQNPAAPIDARQLIDGIAQARETVAAARPDPASLQHYRKTLLERGWTIDQDSGTGQLFSIVAVKGNSSLDVLITAGEKGCKVVVTKK